MNQVGNHADVIDAAIAAHAEVLHQMHALSPAMLQAAQLITESFQHGGKLLLCGNGGSAADAQHIAAELVGRFMRERQALPAIALSTNTSILTAIGNDYGYEFVFSRQVEALGRLGDVLFAISTSGNSSNVVKGAIAARENGLRVIGMTGRNGGDLEKNCDLCLSVPSRETPRIQEMHILMAHIICDLVEQAVCFDKL